MWDNTLLFFSSDNGGPIYRNGSVGSSNYPLHGGKASNFEGGIRVNSFVAGGTTSLPVAARGRKLTGRLIGKLTGVTLYMTWLLVHCNT